MAIQVQSLKKQEIVQVAKIASQCFSGMRPLRKASKWISCNFRAFPRMRYFVAEENGKIIGYILWVEKGGFREKAVFELEQIAVAPEFQGRGVGTKLIQESLKKIRSTLQRRGARLKIVLVSTGTDNQAQKLYKKVLGAQRVALIKDLFRGGEILMIARV